MKSFFKELREQNYDYVIDAQGLMKSALITACAKGLRCGLDRRSARESLASVAYKKKLNVDPAKHVVDRMRLIFSKALGYTLEGSVPDYGLKFSIEGELLRPYVIFFHGTTRLSKEWPEIYWIELAKIALKNGFEVLLPWGNNKEYERAVRIKDNEASIIILPKTNLTDLAKTISRASGVVSIDTGLGHLAAALRLPAVSLYGPSDPNTLGIFGEKQKSLAADFKCAPCRKRICEYRGPSIVFPACFSTVKPFVVWQELIKMMAIG